MKLLLDENISHRIIKYLDDPFSESVHVSSIKEDILEDLEIWKFAEKHNFIIVTYDQDFYEWQQLKGFPPYLVWLRFGNAPTRKIARELNKNKRKIFNLLSSEDTGLLEIH